MIYDVTIIGNGLIGKLLALSLTRKLPELSICIVDKRQEPSNSNRAIALSIPTVSFLKMLDAWDTPTQTNAGIINNIAVGMDSNQPTELAFGDGSSILGYNVLHTDLLNALNQEISSLKNIDFKLGHAVKAINFRSTSAHINFDKEAIQSRLVVGADGKNSFLRKHFAKFRTTHYKQTAVTSKILHSKPHKNQAFEFFLPQGALAFIPLSDDNESTMVWSLKEEYTDSFKQFESIIANITSEHLGTVSLLNALQQYPLSSYVSTHRSGKRWTLVGDAATTIHPVAGQGFNLGVRDVISLTEALSHSSLLGLDIGNYNTLKDYERSRKTDQYALYGITNFAAKPLTTQSLTLRKFFKLGLKFTQKSSFLLDFFNQSAQSGL